MEGRPEEWAGWYHHGWVAKNPVLRAHHQPLMADLSGLADPSLSFDEQMLNLSTPEAGERFLREAKRNVRERPLKFLRNWCGNLVRLLLELPTSVRRTRFANTYALSHLPLLAWTAFVAASAEHGRFAPSRAWWQRGLFLLLSLASYSLSSASARFLFPLVPLWWLGSTSGLAGRSRAGEPALALAALSGTSPL